jgi:predicted transcriptional regulator
MPIRKGLLTVKKNTVEQVRPSDLQIEIVAALKDLCDAYEQVYGESTTADHMTLQYGLQKRISEVAKSNNLSENEVVKTLIERGLDRLEKQNEKDGEDDFGL